LTQMPPGPVWLKRGKTDTMASRKRQKKNKEKTLWIILGIGVVGAFILITFLAG
jgi:hypothetical protein